MSVEEAWGKVCSEVRLLKEMHEHYNFPSHLEEQEKRIDAARAAYDKAVIAAFVAEHPLTMELPQWRPIETAPKEQDENGENVKILVCKEGSTGEWLMAMVAWWEEESENWVVYTSQVIDPYLYFEPTHWMPLPEPPKETPDVQPS